MLDQQRTHQRKKITLVSSLKKNYPLVGWAGWYQQKIKLELKLGLDLTLKQKQCLKYNIFASLFPSISGVRYAYYHLKEVLHK